jgi:hypothetical protein
MSPAGRSATAPLRGAGRAARLGALGLVSLTALWLWWTAAAPALDGPGRQSFGLWRVRHVAVALALLWSAFALLVAQAGPRARTRFVVANAACVACWLLLEGIGALGLVSYPALLGTGGGQPLGGARVPGLDLRGRAQEDEARRWGLPRPAIEYRIQTDRHGFRNVPDRESADVYCLGDSFLVAALVPGSETLPAVLEPRLQRPVMGVALSGLGPQAECELLLDAGLPLEHRLVLHFLFEGNDLIDSAAWRRGQKTGPVPWRSRTLLAQLLLLAQRHTQPQAAYVERHTGYIGDEAYRFYWLRQSFDGLESELAPIAEALRRLRDRIRAAGGEYALVLVPTKLRVLGPFCRFPADSELADWRRHCGPMPAFLCAWGAGEGVGVIDLTEALRAACQRGEVPWFPADTHWNANGCRAAAEALAAWPLVSAWISSGRGR